MKSQGTKETQGINGDAARLARRLDAAAAALGDTELAACPYPRHRALAADWTNAGGRAICGYCHPPARARGARMLMCGCEPQFVTDRAVAIPAVGDVVGRRCSCCGAAPGKKCAGGSAAAVPANKHHAEFKYADVCAARLEVQRSLL